jgi:hypothetical protein
MAQNFTQIQQAFDTAVQTTISGITGISGVASITFFPENRAINFAMLPDVTTSVGIRTNLIPAKTLVETLGTGSYVSIQGLYAIDIFTAVNQGYSGVQQVADALLAAFPRGLILTLTDGDNITINTSSPSSNVNQGAWLMNKLYCRQIIVQWFGYVQP